MSTAKLYARELDVLKKYLEQLDPTQPQQPNALKAIKETGLKLLNAYQAEAKTIVVEKMIKPEPKATKPNQTKKHAMGKPSFNTKK